jgi:Domain of unknown function (DUF222)
MSQPQAPGDGQGAEPGRDSGLTGGDRGLPGAEQQDGGRDPRLAGFAAGGPGDSCPPGPDLAAVVAELSGPAWRCDGADDDELTGLLGRWAALESWAAAGKLGVIRELIRRRARPGLGGYLPMHGDLPGLWEEGLGHEVSAALEISVPAADMLTALAWDLQARLPGTGALLAAGVISAQKAQIISNELAVLDDARAARAEALLLDQVAGKTPGMTGKLAAAAVCEVDPAGAQKRREHAEREEARVRLWRDNGGACALAAYGLPTDAALAAHAAVNDRAQEYKKAKVDPEARMDQLRVMAFCDLLNGITAAARITAAAQARAQAEAARGRHADDRDPDDAADPGAGADYDDPDGAAGPGAGADYEDPDAAAGPGGSGDRGTKGHGAGGHGHDTQEHSPRCPGSGEDRPADGDTGDHDSNRDRPGLDNCSGSGAHPWNDRPASSGPANGTVGGGPWNDGLGNSGPGNGGPGSSDPENDRPGTSGESRNEDSRYGGPGPGGPRNGGGPGSPGLGGQPGGPGPGDGTPGGLAPVSPVLPALTARANLTIPLATLQQLAERPGTGHGLGPLDPALARDLAATAANSPHSRFCVTVTDPTGIAIGHGCARQARPARKNRASPAGQPPGNRDGPGPDTPAPWAFTPRDDPGPPGGYGTWTLTMPGERNLTVKLGPVPVTDCDHRYESHGYEPSDTLRHLVQIRDGTCTFITCSRHARESDFEHAIPFGKGGRTCTCNGGARSRRCHRVKQSRGWTVIQPRPGWHQWTTPSGRTYTKGPIRYPI